MKILAKEAMTKQKFLPNRGDLITIKLPKPTRIGPTGVSIFIDHNGIPWAFDLFENQVGKTFEVVSCKNDYVTYKQPGQISKLHSGFPHVPIEFVVKYK